MPIDPSIPLSVNTGGMDIGKMMSLADMAMKMRMNQQAYQAQNQLRELFQNPENLDAGGMPTSAAMSKIYAISPQIGMSMSKNMLAFQGQQAKLSEDRHKMAVEAGGAALNVYDDALKKGVPKDQALAQYHSALNTQLDEMQSSGLFNGQEMQRIRTSAANPEFVRGFVMTPFQRAEIQKAEQQQARQEFDKPQDVGVRMPDGTVKTVLGQQDKLNGRWYTADENRTPLTNVVSAASPGSTPARTAEAAREAVPLLNKEDADFLADGYWAGDHTISQLAAGWGSSPQAMQNRTTFMDAIVRRGKELGKTGADLASARAEFLGAQAGLRTANVRAAGVEIGVKEIDNLTKPLLDASKAVSRTDFPTWNSVQLAAEKGVGGTAVINLVIAVNAMKNAYSQVATRGGVPTDDARRRSDEIMDKAWSTGQIESGIKQLKIEGASFEKAVGEATGDIGVRIGGRPTSSQTKQQENAPPASMLKEGTVTHVRNPATHLVEGWMLKNGVPTKVP